MNKSSFEMSTRHAVQITYNESTLNMLMLRIPLLAKLNCEPTCFQTGLVQMILIGNVKYRLFFLHTPP